MDQCDRRDGTAGAYVIDVANAAVAAGALDPEMRDALLDWPTLVIASVFERGDVVTFRFQGRRRIGNSKWDGTWHWITGGFINKTIDRKRAKPEDIASPGGT